MYIIYLHEAEKTKIKKTKIIMNPRIWSKIYESNLIKNDIL
jgi:hypothetical protein